MNEFSASPNYRWVVVAVAATMLAIGNSLIMNGISVFIVPLNEEFGWNRGEVSLMNFTGLLGYALGGVAMGRIADRTSTRPVCIFGAVTLGVCLLCASQAWVLWQFYLLFFLAGFFGAGSLFAPLFANVGRWFGAGVGLAIGITSAGQALGQGGVPYATALLINEIGWREALLVLGIVMLVVLIPLGLLIREAPSGTRSNSSNTAPMADDLPPILSANVVIVWMSAAVVFCCICMSVPLIHVVPLAQDRNIALDDAAGVLFVMLIAGIFGRVAFGRLADMIGAIRAYWLASFWQTALVVVYLQMETLAGFYVFAVIYGFGYGGVMTTILVCVRVLVPLSKGASALGIVGMFALFGHAIGGYQGGVFFDFTGDYTQSYINAALAGVVNLIIVGSLFLTVSRRQAAIGAAS